MERWHADEVMFWGCPDRLGLKRMYAMATFRVLFMLNWTIQKMLKYVFTRKPLYFKTFIQTDQEQDKSSKNKTNHQGQFE